MLKNKLTELPFERKAIKGEPCPKGLDAVDTCVYMALKYLYAMYKKGFLSKEEAAKEKRTIIFNMTEQKSVIDFLSRESVSYRDEISKASEAYKENPTIENADNLYAVFYRLPKNWRESKK